MNIKLILIINTLLLIASTSFLAYCVVAGANIKRIINISLSGFEEQLNNRRMRRVVSRYTTTVSIKMNAVEKIEMYLIDKSNIRHYLPFANFHTLVLVCMIFFTATFGFVYRNILFIPSAAVICFLLSLAPVFALDIMGRYNSEKVRRKLAEFISILNRWCAVREDIFYAFEKSIDSGMTEPLCSFVRDMVIQVRGGIQPADALDILQMKVDNNQFRDFIINIKQNVQHSGDVRKLLNNLENQFYRIEEEYNRRKISTYKDRLLMYVIMFVVLFIGFYFLKLNSKVEDFYLNTIQGKSLLTLFCILYAGGLFLTFKVSSFKY